MIDVSEMYLSMFDVQGKFYVSGLPWNRGKERITSHR